MPKCFTMSVCNFCFRFCSGSSSCYVVVRTCDCFKHHPSYVCAASELQNYRSIELGSMLEPRMDSILINGETLTEVNRNVTGQLDRMRNLLLADALTLLPARLLTLTLIV
ncbi:hypothetical protein RvY_14489 [Ramazzottius varieornatus]|uniref:Uncharacterized protein n=1 Tax=Ramazzottius varieornatus TaxID=947166 RepID=A0A1D1VVB2_RAMVA|nr:hypothetical protein RvY_14489 [Ramazzottius varieornatus]